MQDISPMRGAIHAAERGQTLGDPEPVVLQHDVKIEENRV
jgi:hypothetical protein